MTGDPVLRNVRRKRLEMAGNGLEMGLVGGANAPEQFAGCIAPETVRWVHVVKPVGFNAMWLRRLPCRAFGYFLFGSGAKGPGLLSGNRSSLPDAAQCG